VKYRKKPIVVEAQQAHFPPVNAPDGSQQFHSDELGTLPFVVQGALYSILNAHAGAGRVELETLEGWHTVTPGDWIIKGIKGEFYPCNPEIFDLTYELSESEGDAK